MGGILGGGLLLLALFMLVGVFNSGVAAGRPDALLAILITVALPGAAGTALLVRHSRRHGAVAKRKEELRRQTMEAEILRLAGRERGKLTAVDVASILGVSPESAKEALDSLMVRGLAEIEVTDSGVLVYTFHDLKQLDEKHRSKGLLDG